MSSNWPIVTIDEIKAKDKSSIAIGPFGSRMKSDCYVDSGIPVIRGNNLGSGPEFVNDFVYVSEDKANALASCNVYSGDLVFPHRGSIGEVGIVEGENRYVLSTSLMKLTCDAEKAVPQYVYYFFKSARGRHELLKNASQVGTPGIGQPLTSLKSVEIPLPPISAQKQIASVLRTIDSKIHLNHQINQTLEQMAQAIFKSWFVDFEPVKAKIAALEAGGSEEDALLAAMRIIAGDAQGSANAAGRTTPGAAKGDKLTRLQAEHPEQYAELRATAELFPSALQDSELGEIPEGWESGLLNDICEFQNGYAFKSIDWSDSGFAVVKIGSVKPAFVDIQSCSYVADKTIAGLERFELFPGDLLVGMTGYPGETGLVPKTENRVFLNQRVGRLKPKQNNLKALLYCNVRDPDFKQYVEGQAHGSAQANVSGKAIGHYPITIPTGSVVEQFSALIDPLLQQKLNLNAEAMNLAITRDTLLPKLLSGEVSAPEIKDPSQEASRHSDIGDGVAFDE